MQRIIFLDGCDGCAKTSIAKFLSKTLNVPYFKNVRQKMFFENDPGYFARAMKYGDPYFGDYLKQTGASVILDRGFPSEFAYSRAFNRPTDMNMLRIVDEIYAELGSKILIPFRSDYSIVKDEFNAINLEKLNQLDEFYRDFCEWTKCDVMRFCVDDEDIEKQMQLIMPFLGVNDA